jgi:nitrogen permease regulator 2-like protein
MTRFWKSLGTKDVPDWPDLLHLYSRLKIGKTVYEWMDEYNVEGMGIDVRRFITFGVIKVAFLFSWTWVILIPLPGILA